MALHNLFKFEKCEDWLFNCPFSTQPDNCINKFCNGTNAVDGNFGTCAQDFPTAGACCSKSNPASCLAAFQANLNDSDKSGACASVREALVSCDLAVTGFATLAPEVQASCLCYSSGTYNPSSWDNAATSCYMSGSAQHPILYPILTSQSSEALGFCTKYAGPAAVSAVTTTVVETESISGSMTTVTTAVTNEIGGGNTLETGSMSTVTAVVTSGVVSSTMSATPGTGVSSSGSSSSTTTGATTSASAATTSGSKTNYPSLKLKLGIVGLILPSILIATFA